MKDDYLAELDQNGIIILHDLLPANRLQSMQRSFESRLARMCWNDSEGYQKTEFHRHMVQDVLTLDQGFVDLALHPLVKEVLSSYLGSTYQLVEAKGWLSHPTKRDFHGWHGDAWYDQRVIRDIPREVKVAIYLTDVKTGAFHYIRGSHRKQHPRNVQSSEVQDVPSSRIVEAIGQAGTVILFDTSGIHRQGMPILEPRQAVFLNYHDPAIPLQKEDRDYYRYHPLVLNAAFLGSLSAEDCRILGFGDKRNYIPAFTRSPQHPRLESVFKMLFESSLRYRRLLYYRQRAYAKLKRALGLGIANG